MPHPAMLMLPVADLSAAAAFYRAVFGWDAQPIGPAARRLDSGGALSIVLIERDYLTTESGIASGRPALSPVSVVALADHAAVDAFVERAEKAGASVSSPARMRDFGIYSAYIVDPDGNGWEALVHPAG